MAAAREIEITLPELHDGQSQVRAEAKRFNVLMCGRRWGKTDLVSQILIETALDGYPAGYFTPSYKTLVEVWENIIYILGDSVARKNANERRIELINGGMIEMWTLDDPNAGRSRKYKVIIIDEAQLIAGLIRKWRLSLRPTLLDYQGGAWFVGTALSDTDFAQLFELAGKPERATTWARWQRPTSENPYIPQSELDEARADTPEDEYQQEYEAVLVPGGAGVFKHVVRAIYGPMMTWGELVAHANGRALVIGVDLGKSKDFTVFAVLDLELGRVIYYERTQQDYLAQYPRLKTMCQEIRPNGVVIETNIEKTFTEMARRDGLPVIPFFTGPTTKQPLIEKLQLAFEREEIGIPDDPILKAELLAYKSKRLSGGGMSYSAPDGQHDDTVMATALAWWGKHSTREWGERSIYE